MKRKKSNRKYYILPVYGSVSPEPLHGPFKTFDNMLRKARKLRAEQSEGEDGLFWMMTWGTNRRPAVGAFTNGQMEGY